MWTSQHGVCIILRRPRECEYSVALNVIASSDADVMDRLMDSVLLSRCPVVLHTSMFGHVFRFYMLMYVACVSQSHQIFA